jgi:hypothetical protein
VAKRSDGDFERVPNDLYRTWDTRALPPLLRQLPRGQKFVEPCAGHGDLIDQLTNAGMKCVAAFDIDPQRGDIERADALNLKWKTSGGVWITNPPWTRDIMHAIIKNLCVQAPLWALFDADWVHTDQSPPYMIYLRKIVSVGRLKWIPGSPHDAKDNAAWHLFDGTKPPGRIEFIGRY